MRFLALLIASLLLSGCASTPPSSTVSHRTAVLVDKSEKDGDQKVRYAFIAVDGRKGTRPTEGRRLLTVAFRRKGDYWDAPPAVVATGEVYADLISGHRYTVTGKYHPGEMRGTYRIIDEQTGELASEEFEVVYVTPAPGSTMFLPIFIAK